MEEFTLTSEEIPPLSFSLSVSEARTGRDKVKPVAMTMASSQRGRSTFKVAHRARAIRFPLFPPSLLSIIAARIKEAVEQFPISIKTWREP
ncbi:MAG: hypothetical protein EOQ95_18380 [Mesorhizobium sp.]|nr:MAG: hypothetical protein EOQ95_18380 [Mesorhizobium sp.]